MRVDSGNHGRPICRGERWTPMAAVTRAMRPMHCLNFLALVAALAPLLAFVFEARAAWMHLRDSTVWDRMGVHFNFRLVRTRDNESYRIWAIDCRTMSALPLSLQENGRELLSDIEWFTVRPDTVGQQISEHACVTRHERQPSDKWLHSSHGEPVSKQWSQVGELLDFRLTHVSFPRQPGTEIWAVDCRTYSTKLISSVSADDRDTLVNHRWRSGRQDDSSVRYACGTYRG